MAFKGIISIGTEVEAIFSSERDNSGSASLLLGSGPLGGGSDAVGAVIAAGGTGAVHLNASISGSLRVLVDVAEGGDSGMLEVKVGGAQRDREAVSGVTTWLYSVE